ncbi:MAG: hypothetical protein IPG96_20555 [Proteobacteria bacterium]|nr:hypothetical protein [Pseudomonadota bacterium]
MQLHQRPDAALIGGWPVALGVVLEHRELFVATIHLAEQRLLLQQQPAVPAAQQLVRRGALEAGRQHQRCPLQVVQRAR